MDIYTARCKVEHPRMVAGKCPWCGREIFNGLVEDARAEPEVFDAQERRILQYVDSRGGRFTAEQLLGELVRLDESYRGYGTQLDALLTKLVHIGYLHQTEEDGQQIYIKYK